MKIGDQGWYCCIKKCLLMRFFKKIKVIIMKPNLIWAYARFIIFIISNTETQTQIYHHYLLLVWNFLDCKPLFHLKQLFLLWNFLIMWSFFLILSLSEYSKSRLCFLDKIYFSMKLRNRLFIGILLKLIKVAKGWVWIAFPSKSSWKCHCMINFLVLLKLIG